MHKLILLGTLVFSLFSCTSTKKSLVTKESDFTLAFGSCNKSDLTNSLWDDIVALNPNVWVWGGDVIYADTDDMIKLKKAYKTQSEVAGYKNLKEKIPVIGTWDDHDYGKNDGGVEFEVKRESQQEFLDFMGVSKDSPRRNQEGVYAEHNYILPNGKIKVIVLDTRYFRTALTPDTETRKRHKPNVYGEGTVLGKSQWLWLEKVLNTSDADFNVIVSSIQFLSKEHGFEAWGNFPHEVDKMTTMIAASKAKGVVILSGDRHISEFSKTKVEGLNYPLIDFTSSGLTHAYSKFSGEANMYRVGEVVSTESFGVLQFDFKAKKVNYKIIGNNNKLLGALEQSY